MLRPYAVIFLLVGTSAFADSCLWMKHAEGKSKDDRYRVRMDWEGDWRGHWKGRLEDTKTGKVTEADMAGLDSHAHFSVLVVDDGSRVAIFETSTTGLPGGSLIVYDRELKLLKGFAFNELLTKIDLAAVRYSVSHCRFMADSTPDGKRSFWLQDDGKTLAIYLKSKRTALVSLMEPKIIPTPDVVPEVFEFEEGLPPGKTDHERFQGQWMITECRSGIAVMPDEDDAKEDPSYLTFEGDKLIGSLSGIDKPEFNVDSTLHTIDLTGAGKLKGIYEFQGGKLRLCFPIEEGKQRPRNFHDETLTYWTYTLQRRKVKK